MKSFSILYPYDFSPGENVIFIINGEEYVHKIIKSDFRQAYYLLYPKRMPHWKARQIQRAPP